MKKLMVSLLLSSQLSAFYHSDFDRYFDMFMNSDIFPSFGFTSYPPMNIYEDDKNYLIEVEMAGMDKDDIEVSISNDNILTIRGEKKRNSRYEKEDTLRYESFVGKFQKSITLPSDIDSSKIDVKYENGILKIRVARSKEKSKSRIIPIH